VLVDGREKEEHQVHRLTVGSVPVDSGFGAPEDQHRPRDAPQLRVRDRESATRARPDQAFPRTDGVDAGLDVLHTGYLAQTRA
jgi:hypothetical protein